MKLLFWSCAFLVLFAYAGYPIYLYVRARYWPRRVQRASTYPRIAIVLAVHNEEKNLLRKLSNLEGLDYPPERLEVIVVSDGSTDQTNQILREWQRPSRRAVILPDHCGKANALNHGIAAAQGELICFVDARQTIASDGLRNLASNFADPSVGCASGELILRGSQQVKLPHGGGLYWRLEKNMRKWEGMTGSTVGATGAFYAVRRSLVPPLPGGTILDDVYIPLHVARQGSRVIFDPSAVVWDDLNPSLKQEFRRKVRTLTGNYQLLQLAPWVLTRSNPLHVRVICHKLLRLIIPFALIGILVSTFWLRQSAYGLVFGLQVAFYLLAASAVLPARLGLLSRAANISLTFIMMNTAAAVALAHFLTGKKAAWAR